MKGSAETRHYTETHGTGTALGDPIEVNSLRSLHQTQRSALALGALKSRLG